MCEVFCQDNFLEAHRRSEKELDSATIGSKIVVNEISQQQQRVGAAHWECEIGSTCEKIPALPRKSNN